MKFFFFFFFFLKKLCFWTLNYGCKAAVPSFFKYLNAFFAKARSMGQNDPLCSPKVKVILAMEYYIKLLTTYHMKCSSKIINRFCRTHKNFQLFIKCLLKISFFTNFFVFFGSLKTKDIFLPSIKFSLNYHRQNSIQAFFKRMTVKYLCQLLKLLKKKYSKFIQIVF